MYALIINNTFIDKAESVSDLNEMMNWAKTQNYLCKIVNIEKASSIKVYYTELGGPNGYGHSETSFEIYGGIIYCLHCLGNWAKSAQRIFGPDYRDIRDYFKCCRCFINGEDKSEWFWRVFVDTLKKDIIYI